MIDKYVRSRFGKTDKLEILDLGTGTGITAKLIQDALPKSHIDAVDFSDQMLERAKEKLGVDNVSYILGDFATIKFTKKYDIIVAVIGIHHQNNKGKKALFRKIYSALKPGGVFIFGDLVTHKDQHVAALNDARHYHHLVVKTSNERELTEWAHHHMFLNDLAPIEDQIEWLSKVGFKTRVLFKKFNTALIVASKE
jgi:tRNA (cmo5U34)-methyltransferase